MISSVFDLFAPVCAVCVRRCAASSHKLESPVGGMLSEQQWLSGAVFRRQDQATNGKCFMPGVPSRLDHSFPKPAPM